MGRQLGIIFAMLALHGCSGDPWRGIYEGTRSRNEALKKPEERASMPKTPSYDEYKKERERIKQDEAPKQ